MKFSHFNLYAIRPKEVAVMAGDIEVRAKFYIS